MLCQVLFDGFCVARRLVPRQYAELHESTACCQNACLGNPESRFLNLGESLNSLRDAPRSNEWSGYEP